MRTIRVNLGEGCGAAQASTQFEEALGGTGIDSRRGDLREVFGVIADLDRRGRELAGCGSQFRCDRVIETPTLRVKITARYGQPRRRFLPPWVLSLLGRS